MQLSLLLSMFFFCFALGSPSDVIYIEQLVANQVILLDLKNFAFENIFTKNATYNSGSGPNVYGIPAIENAIANLVKDGGTFGGITTKSITLGPPFDDQGGAGTAKGTLFITAVTLGSNSSGPYSLRLAKYEDKYAKTGAFEDYGGWRISERIVVNVVSATYRFVTFGLDIFCYAHTKALIQASIPL